MRRISTATLLLLTLCAFCMLAPKRTWAGDDFNNIVHQIESQYHVHQNYHFLMGFAGMVVKCSSHFTGVKNLKMAIFDDQHLVASDGSIDEVIQAAGKSGWTPLIRSYSRRTGEHTYIYAQNGDNDMKLLMVVMDPDDTVIMQVKINPRKLSQFINQHEHQ